jgi:hypothetical protein
MTHSKLGYNAHVYSGQGFIALPVIGAKGGSLLTMAPPDDSAARDA